MNELSLRKGEEYLRIDYEYVLEGHGDDNCLILPSFDINFILNVFINNRLITTEDYNCISEKLGEMLINSDLWNFLNMKPSLFIVEDATIKLCLRQKIYHDIESSTLKKLSEVRLNLSIYCANDLPFDSLVAHLNYLVSVWLINVEYKFPCVFSVFGCQFFINQVKWLKWYIQILFPDSNNTNELFINNLSNLQKIILHEYNTLNVWKEIEMRKLRSKNLTDTNQLKDSLDVKSLTFNMNVFQSKCLKNEFAT